MCQLNCQLLVNKSMGIGRSAIDTKSLGGTVSSPESSRISKGARDILRVSSGTELGSISWERADLAQAASKVAKRMNCMLNGGRSQVWFLGVLLAE